MRRTLFVILVSLVVVLGVAACGSDPTPTPTSVPSSSPLEKLIEEAKAASDHTIIAPLARYSPDLIRAHEAAFEEKFGIPVTIEIEPGHPTRDTPVKVMEGAPAGRAVVDQMNSMWIPGILPVLDGGYLQKPRWDALTEAWPDMKERRAATPDITAPDGSKLSDYCYYSGNVTWAIAYNTQYVTADEIKGLTWDSLTDPKWKGRFVVDVLMTGVEQFPFRAGWDVERMTTWVKAMKANGMLAVTGGSSGVLQALVSGEGHLGIAAYPSAVRQTAAGAPIALTYADFVPGIWNFICNPSITPHDTALANLFFGWFETDGALLREKLQKDGTNLLPGSVTTMGNRLTALGLTIDDLIGFRTREEAKILAEYQAAARAAFTE